MYWYWYDATKNVNFNCFYTAELIYYSRTSFTLLMEPCRSYVWLLIFACAKPKEQIFIHFPFERALNKFIMFECLFFQCIIDIGWKFSLISHTFYWIKDLWKIYFSYRCKIKCEKSDEVYHKRQQSIFCLDKRKKVKLLYKSSYHMSYITVWIYFCVFWYKIVSILRNTKLRWQTSSFAINISFLHVCKVIDDWINTYSCWLTELEYVVMYLSAKKA